MVQGKIRDRKDIEQPNASVQKAFKGQGARVRTVMPRL